LLVAGFIGVYWGKAFGKRVVVSTHSLYEFPEKGWYRKFAIGIFERADAVLTLSKQSAKEIESLGIRKDKIKVFTYWVDLDKFLVQKDKKLVKKKVGWKKKFVVFFVGRLVPEKGIPELLDAAKKWNKDIVLAIAGSGPLENHIQSSKQKIKNLEFLGRIDQEDLPDYYNEADLVIVPSTHEEGFGRVILEALSCGTPVIGSNRGAIPEAMDNTVGELIDISPENIKKTVEYYHKDKDALVKKAYNARKFAEKRYSEKNIQTILLSYS
jgi:glycosyltransferase involved in cell wall biosynthesis